MSFTRSSLLVACLMFFSVSAWGQRGYEVVSPAAPTATGDKIEVLEFFWYGCPHCFKFLPVMEAYEDTAPEYVEIRRMPAIFRPDWEVHVRRRMDASDST